MMNEENEQEETIEEPIQPAEAQAIEVPEPVEPPVFFTPPAPVAEVEYEPVREPTPVPVLEPEPVSEPERDELASLFEVPQPEDNDMATDHLFEVGEDLTGFEDDDLSDLVDVSQADIMGDFEEPYPGTPPSTELPQRVPVRRFKRTPRRYPPPPTSLGGLRQ